MHQYQSMERTDQLMLLQKYNPNLRINIEDDYYIRFKDQSIPQALIAAGYGDVYGITMSDAASFNASTLYMRLLIKQNR